MNSVEAEFSALAPEYETNRLAGWYKAHADRIREHCPSVEHGDILDVGCGTGYLLRSLLRDNPGARGIGVDVAAGMIDQARRLATDTGAGNIRFFQADWETFDTDALAGRSVKLVVCANAFHYFSSPARAAQKLHAVLEEDGMLLVLERDKSRSLMTRMWGWLHRHCIKDNVEFYDRNELITFFKDAGFASVHVVQSVRRFLWKNKLYTSIVLIKCLKNDTPW